MRIVGFVYNGRRDQEHAFGPIPHMAGCIEALPGPGPKNTLSVQIGERNYDYEIGEYSYQQQRSFLHAMIVINPTKWRYSDPNWDTLHDEVTSAHRQRPSRPAASSAAVQLPKRSRTVVEHG